MKKLEWRKMLQLAFAQQKQGKFAAAIADYQEILTFRPEEAQVYYYLGSALLQDDRLKEAMNTYEKVLSLAPNSFPDTYYNLGFLYQKLGRTNKAIDAYKKFVAVKSNFAPAYNNLGKALQEQGKIDEAIQAYQKAIPLKEDYGIACHNLKCVLEEQEKIDKTIRNCGQVSSRNPRYVPAYNSLAIGLEKQGKIDEAITALKKAIGLNSNYAPTYKNLGVILQKQGKWEDARIAYKQAIVANPRYELAYNNLANTQEVQGKVEEAIATCQEAIDINPNWAALHVRLGMFLLQKGEFKLGLQEYQWRFKYQEFTKNTSKISSFPIWDGKSSLGNKTILIRAEQGLGDMLQFSRYVPILAAKGAKVIIESPAPLVSLLETVPEVEKVIVAGTVVTEVDYQVWLMSLPLLCGTTLDTIPATIPYLFPSTTSLPQLLNNNKNDKLNIGLVWNSHSISNTSKKRSCPLEEFTSLLERPNINWYSLQKELSPGDLNLLEKLPIVDLKESLVDFNATAAIIAQLDLVISIDTSVAHLAGAIGKPVWALLPAVPDWRWLLKREDTPWYPTMRLFRQTEPGDWSMVLEQVENALSNLLE